MPRIIRRAVLGAAAAAFLWWSRRWLWQVAGQLGWGVLLALVAWPLMKRFETRVKSGWAAALALTSLAVIVSGLILLLLPPLIRQGRELAAMVPGLIEWAQKLGIWQKPLLTKAQELLSSAIPAVAGWLGNLVGSIGRWMLSPVFAFYFLRDRALIAGWLMRLIPRAWRDICLRFVQDMRIELAGYLRGQWMISIVVGACTAAGLLLCGVPSWLALGAVMGVLELVPYVGPVLGCAAVVGFALPGGWQRTLWALGVVLAVQQLESLYLSPKFVSGATKLHPLVVLVALMTGTAIAGVGGMLASVPLVLCVRSAVRCLGGGQYEKVFSKR